MTDYEKVLQEFKEQSEKLEQINDLESRQAELEKQTEEAQARLEQLNKEAETPKDTADFERLTYEKLKRFEGEIEDIKANTTKPEITKQEILSISNPKKRQKAIAENLHLFQTELNSGNPVGAEHMRTASYKTQMLKEVRRLGLNIETMTLNDAQQIKDGMLRVMAIEEILRRA